MKQSAICPVKLNERRHNRINVVGIAALVAGALMANAAQAETPNFTFHSIDGSVISLQELRGAPVLLINTAMQDGFSVQLNGVKELRRAYGDEDLTIILTPRDDTRAAAISPDAVARYYRDLHRIKMPITYPVEVGGISAHPFYEWLEAEMNAPVRWNFNKILLNSEGDVERVYGAEVWPTDGRITRILDQRVEVARVARAETKTATTVLAAADTSPTNLNEPSASEAEVLVAALMPSSQADATEVTYSDEIVGEIASAEAWPPLPEPRPVTASEITALITEAVAADKARYTEPWPPRPVQRPDDLMQTQLQSENSQTSARAEFVLSSAD